MQNDHEVERYRLENEAEEAIVSGNLEPARAALQSIVALDGVEPGPYAAALGVLECLTEGNAEEAFDRLAEAAGRGSALTEALGHAVGEALETAGSWLMAAAAFRVGSEADHLRAQALQESHDLDETQLAAYTPEVVPEAPPAPVGQPAPPPAAAPVSRASVRQAMAEDYTPITDLEVPSSSQTPALVALAVLMLSALAYWWSEDFAPSARFFRSEGNVLVTFALAVAILGVLVYIIRGLVQSSKQASIVSTETCLLCDGAQVMPYRSASGEAEYRCQRCGYDSNLENQPGTSRMVVRYQDVKNALFALRSAERAVSNAAVLSHIGGDHEHGYMAEASRQMREAHSLLGAIADEFPQVLHVPATGSDYAAASTVTALSAIFGETSFAAMKRHKAERQAIAKEVANVGVYLGAIEQIAGWMRYQILSAGNAPR